MKVKITSIYYMTMTFIGYMACNTAPDKMNIVRKDNVIAFDTSFVAKRKLSHYGMFKQPLKEMIAKDETVFPYDLNSELFSDYALKKRFIYLPPNTAMTYDASHTFDFPNEAMIFKFFYYPGDMRKPNDNLRIVETRVLYKQSGIWQAYTYVWDSLQQDAYLSIAGDQTTVTWKDQEGKLQTNKYSVPNMIQCKSCHEYKGVLVPIGPAARHLNKISTFAENSVNQIQWWKENKKALQVPPIDELPSLVNYHDKSKSIDQRTRSYLDINCAHCHNHDGPARNSALNLRYDEQNKIAFGVYKTPIAAGNGSGGLRYDIVPGKPEESILYYRMNSIAPGVAMPELSRSLLHTEGLDLVKEWIVAME